MNSPLSSIITSDLSPFVPSLPDPPLLDRLRDPLLDPHREKEDTQRRVNPPVFNRLRSSPSVVHAECGSSVDTDMKDEEQLAAAPPAEETTTATDIATDVATDRSSSSGDLLRPTLYPSKNHFTEATPCFPVTVQQRDKPHPSAKPDKGHRNKHNVSLDNVNVSSMVYGDYLTKNFDYFQFFAPNPVERIKNAYIDKYCQVGGQYGTHAKHNTFVPIRGVLMPGVVSVTPPMEPKTHILSFFYLNFTRLECWESDLPALVLLYLKEFTDATVYEVKYLDQKKVGLGQVMVLTDRQIDFKSLFEKYPCICDHNGIFVLKKNYNGPMVEVQRNHKKNTDVYQFPPELAKLIAVGDALVRKED